MDNRHEEIKALIAPYALGAMPAEEEAIMRSHILGCDECRAEVESFGPVTSALSLAIDPVTLPDGFVERTLAKAGEGRPATAPAPTPIRKRSLAWVFSAAALVLVLAVGAWLTLGSTGGAPDSDQVAELLDRPGLELNAKDGDVQAKVVETDDGTKFVARGLDPAPEGKVYELWKMTETCIPGNKGPCDVEPAGTFEVEDGLVVAEFEGGLEDFDAAAVTIEEEVVDAPKGPPVLASYSL